MNCLPAEGHLTWGGDRIEFKPEAGLGNLDWGRGIRDYRSFWVWASASGFLPDGRLNLEFTPFVERVAKTNLLLITSEVHQMFGRYRGAVVADDGVALHLDGPIGWAEEHHARW